MKFTSTILIAFATSGADARRLLPATAANVSTVAPINLTESHLTKPVDIKSVTTPSDQDITVEMHEFMQEHTDDIKNWSKEHAEFITDLMMEGKQIAEAVQAEMKDASATATEKQEKAKQIVQRMITKYMQEPAHKQQFEQIKGEIMDFFSAHKADISKWVTAHKTQIVAWLKAKIAEVESGNLKDESCDLTDPKCMKEMGITQPEVQKYLVEHKVEVQKKMEAYKAKYAEFITKHKGKMVAFLQAVTKVVETGDMSAVKTWAASLQHSPIAALPGATKTGYKKPMLGTDPNTYTPKSLSQSEAPAAAVGKCTSMHGNGDTCAKITSEADCGASNGSCIWKAPAATGAAPATSRYLETATPADLQVALGTYKGDAKKGIGCVFGYCATTIKVNTIATAKAGNKMDVVVKGSGIATVNMDCKDEPYTLDAAGKITLLNYPHTDKSTSKCIADALPLGVSLKSLTYDAAKHEVDISVGPIGLVVTAKCDDCAAAPAAAPAAAAPASRKLRGGVHAVISETEY